jgi:hypothetical protein
MQPQGLISVRYMFYFSADISSPMLSWSRCDILIRIGLVDLQDICFSHLPLQAICGANEKRLMQFPLISHELRSASIQT